MSQYDDDAERLGEEDDDYAAPTRTELPGCQVGVYSPGKMDLEDDCGEPAVATWDWGNGPLFVCEKHDAEIAAANEEMEESHELHRNPKTDERLA